MEFLVAVLESSEALALLRAEWDHLAATAGRPFSAPIWVLACWAALRPDGAAMRVVEVRREDELVGIMPLLSAAGTYQAIGCGVAAVEPLAKPGLEEDVAAAFAAALADLDEPPATLELSLRDDGPDWVGLLAGAWPGRGAWSTVEESVPVPAIDVGTDGFQGWLDAKSSSFRREARRKQKRLEEAGASFRFADAASLERDVAEFLRLHRTRLAGQGGSSLDDERIGPLLVSVGRDLLPEDRFRLLLLEVDGTAVAAQILICAGSEASAWNSGFDEQYANLSPSVQCILEALRDAAERGESTMSLGPGAQAYKGRLATSTQNLVSHVLVPRRRGSVLVRGRLLARSARRAAGAHLRRARAFSPRQAVRAARG